MNKQYIATNLQTLKDNGFKYNYQEKYYTYDFPVYKYKRRPVIFCKVFVYEEDKTIRFEVVDGNNNLYASYYNREYGKNELLNGIDSVIRKQFKILSIKQIVRRNSKYD